MLTGKRLKAGIRKILFVSGTNYSQECYSLSTFWLTDYLELVDWTSQILREDKRGTIPENMPSILNRLNIESKHWLYLTKNVESPFKGMNCFNTYFQKDNCWACYDAIMPFLYTRIIRKQAKYKKESINE
ncbi:hypothetical protein MNBD_BACTEROID06-159 [hydrothermal vent metagenome]|uniref:Transposase n=1 Tax=hydrothermal vent metagenome TaxID=652676 RepID=A0A3B0U7Y5_9ZZZZ